MTETITKFDEKAKCPKCGQANPGSRFCKGDDSVKPEAFTTTPPGPTQPNRQPCFLDVTGEHIHRTCARCGYDWPQRPLDYSGS